MTTTPNKSKLVAAAILFGDIKGSTKGAEEDESATVQQLREYRGLIRQAVEGAGASFYKVKFEGDGFMAVFDTPHEMVACGFALQDEFRRRGWLVRLGGSSGAVYRDEGGDVDGADVNRAARIQAKANALLCEFLVSQTVADIVRNRVPGVCFEAHEPIEAPGVAEPLEVCAVAAVTDRRAPAVPPRGKRPALPIASDTAGKRRWQSIAGFVTLALLGSALLWYSTRPRVIPPQNLETVAVFEFENQKADDANNGWCSKALQTNLATGLSDIDQLDVIPLVHIKQYARRAGLELFEAARELNVIRLVMGSYAVDGEQMRIDASVIDAQKGVQTAAWSVTGPRSAFFELQEDLRRKMLEKFNIQLTKAQKTKIETAALETAKKSETAKNARVDKYRMLLEGEGVTSTSVPAPKDVDPQAAGPSDSMQIGACIASFLVRPALAEAALFASKREVEQFLEQYRTAYESGDIPRLASLYVAFPENQRKSVVAYMSSISDLRVELADVDIQITPTDAAVTYTRRDSFVDNETEEELSLEVRLTRFLVRDGDRLKFANAE